MCFGMACLDTARLQCTHLRMSGLSVIGFPDGKAFDIVSGTLLMAGLGEERVELDLDLLPFVSSESQLPAFFTLAADFLESPLNSAFSESSFRSSNRFSSGTLARSSFLMEGFGAGVDVLGLAFYMCVRRNSYSCDSSSRWAPWCCMDTHQAICECGGCGLVEDVSEPWGDSL